MKLEVTAEVAKESYELASGLAKFAAVVKKEVDDNGGWEMGDDLPGVIQAAVSELLPALDGVTKLSSEIKEDKVAFAKGVLLGLSELVEVFVPSEEK